jgi:hypothetical protein
MAHPAPITLIDMVLFPIVFLLILELRNALHNEFPVLEILPFKIHNFAI